MRRSLLLPPRKDGKAALAGRVPIKVSIELKPLTLRGGAGAEIYGHWQPEWNSDPSRIRTDVYYQLAG